MPQCRWTTNNNPRLHQYFGEFTWWSPSTIRSKSSFQYIARNMRQGYWQYTAEAEGELPINSNILVRLAKLLTKKHSSLSAHIFPYIAHKGRQVQHSMLIAVFVLLAQNVWSNNVVHTIYIQNSVSVFPGWNCECIEAPTEVFRHPFDS
jgi:hypothetical protein